MGHGASGPRSIRSEFWRTHTEQAVQIVTICEEEGVRMYSLGNETERLFRTRPVGYWRNDFGDELREMVRQVRAVYGGLVTYNMHSFGFTRGGDREFEQLVAQHLWEDLDLDVIGVSAWLPLLAQEALSTVPSVPTLRREYERLFQEIILPLAERYRDRPIVFTEYGAIDTTWRARVGRGCPRRSRDGRSATAPHRCRRSPGSIVRSRPSSGCAPP